jgi:glycerophosphoryl diester phosphodiesterase/predicted amidohydrolase
MKLCAIQQPYPYTPAEADSAVEFVIRELESCDDSLDLILTPEYTNCPTKFPSGEESLACARKHYPALEKAARDAARRCDAIVAVSCCAPTPHGWRNTTRVFAPNGEVAGEYYKQQLTVREPNARGVDASYATSFRAPEIVEVDGIRLGFVTCYDAYFEEYIEYLGYRRPDIVLVASHQRGEPCENLRRLNQMLAYHTDAFVLRASVGMGEDKETGGTSLVVDPAGKILADAGQHNGKLVCDIGDPHRKYRRSNSFGGKMILNRDFIEQGRTPWSYRPGGSCVKPGDGKMPYPRVCAHRGFNTVAPENSMPAFGAAIALGAEEIEFDLWESADGVPVSIHDSNLERVSDGAGKVREKTFAELEQLDFGAKSGANFAGLRIVRFEDILRTFPRQVVMNIHIKSVDGERFSRPFVKKIAAMLDEYDCASHAYFVARDEVMEAALEVAPHIPRCMGAGGKERRMAIVDRAVKYQCQKVQFFTTYWTPELIKRAHDLGMRCNYFYCDDPEQARQMLELGIDTVLTNDYWTIAQVKERFVRETACGQKTPGEK